VIWHLVTGEYPPDCGGVGDYSALLARELVRAGDEVFVWVPGLEANHAEHSDGRFHLLPLPDRFGPHSKDVLARAWRDHPGIVLLQYVPNALGAKGANLRFCRWLHAAAHGGLDIRVMFHEPYFYFSTERPWRNLLAVVQRMMAAELIKASRCLYVSSDAWLRCLEPYGHLPPSRTLPIPSTIPDTADPERVRQFRGLIRRETSAPVIGHFGTYGDHMSSALAAVVPAIAEQLPLARFAFIGARSGPFLERLTTKCQALQERSWTSGRLGSTDVAAALRACDLLVQPYPDGVTTRRTTVMAGLANAVPVVTTDGLLTEAVWRDTHAPRLAPAGNVAQIADAAHRLIDAPADRAALGRAGRQLYLDRFSIERTVDALRAPQPIEAVAG
jgi:glycosyltransferase involved in cell wall biosynthesis